MTRCSVFALPCGHITVIFSFALPSNLAQAIVTDRRKKLNSVQVGVITLLRGCSFFLVFVLACVVTTEPSTELSCSLRHNDDRALTNKSEQCPTIPNTDWMTRVDLIKLRNCQFLFQCMSLCKAGKSVKKDFNSIKIKDQLCRKPCRIKNFIT